MLKRRDRGVLGDPAAHSYAEVILSYPAIRPSPFIAWPMSYIASAFRSSRG